MNGDSHVLWGILDGRVDQSSILPGKGIKILSSSGGSLAHVQIAKVSEVGIVELHVCASGFAQCLDLCPVSCGQILEEVVEVRVGSDIDGCTSSSEMSLEVASQSL